MHAPSAGLYKEDYERDSCGFGLIASLDDAPSHWLVRTAISSLIRLTHRGAIAADGKTGDGCGLLLKRPEGFLRAVAAEAGIELAERFASGLVFHSRQALQAEQARLALARELARQGLEVAGWRAVPAAVAPRAPLPLPRPQRRDQHHPGQPQLGEGPRAAALIAPSPGAAGGAAAGVARRLGLPEPRQHARGAADGRPRSAAGHAAPHTAGMARARRAGSRPARLLRVLLGAHGALGRSGRRRADGWALRALHARSQRAAAGALLHPGQPLSHHRLRARRVGLRPP